MVFNFEALKKKAEIIFYPAAAPYPAAEAAAGTEAVLERVGSTCMYDEGRAFRQVAATAAAQI